MRSNVFDKGDDNSVAVQVYSQRRGSCLWMFSSFKRSEHEREVKLNHQSSRTSNHWLRNIFAQVMFMM